MPKDNATFAVDYFLKIPSAGILVVQKIGVLSKKRVEHFWWCVWNGCERGVDRLCPGKKMWHSSWIDVSSACFNCGYVQWQTRGSTHRRDGPSAGLNAIGTHSHNGTMLKDTNRGYSSARWFIRLLEDLPLINAPRAAIESTKNGRRTSLRPREVVAHLSARTTDCISKMAIWSSKSHVRSLTNNR